MDKCFLFFFWGGGGRVVIGIEMTTGDKDIHGDQRLIRQSETNGTKHGALGFLGSGETLVAAVEMVRFTVE